MSGDDQTLGKSMGRTIADLGDLIEAEDDRKKRDALRTLHRRLSAKLQALIDQTVKKDTREYTVAVAAVLEANKSIRKSIKDTAGVADTMKKIRKAVVALGKLLAILSV